MAGRCDRWVALRLPTLRRMGRCPPWPEACKISAIIQTCQRKAGSRPSTQPARLPQRLRKILHGHIGGQSPSLARASEASVADFDFPPLLGRDEEDPAQPGSDPLIDRKGSDTFGHLCQREGRLE